MNLSLTGPDAKAHFRLIEDRYKEQVDARLSPLGELEWRLMPDSKESQILVQRDVSPADPTTWPALNVWMASTLRVMHDLFRPIVRTLDASDFRAEEAAPPLTPLVPLTGGV